MVNGIPLIMRHQKKNSSWHHSPPAGPEIQHHNDFPSRQPRMASKGSLLRKRSCKFIVIFSIIKILSINFNKMADT